MSNVNYVDDFGNEVFAREMSMVELEEALELVFVGLCAYGGYGVIRADSLAASDLTVEV